MSATEPLYVLTITTPAFILIALGYLCVKAAWLDKSGVQALGWFITRVGIPAAIFLALSTRDFNEILRLDYLLVYGGGSLLAYYLVFLFAKFTLKKTLTESAFFGLGASMSNSLMIGYPIIIELFGPAALVPFALTLVVENLIILPMSLALADTGKHKQSRFVIAFAKALGSLSKNPIFISIIAGVITSALSISLPAILTTSIDSLAATVAGLAQFTIGGILAGAALRFISKDISLVVIGKLLLHPAAVLLLIFLMPPLDPLFVSIAVILACMPMFSVYAVLGIDYGLDKFCTAVLLPTTILSFVTINLAIYALGLKFGLG